MPEQKNWKLNLLKDPDDFLNSCELRYDVYCMSDRLSDSKSTVWTESVFDERSKRKHSTTWAEQSISNKLLESAIQEIKIQENDVIIDAGCGVGRFVKFLLSKGFQKIIAFNYEYEPLMKLSASLTDEEKERVLLICADVFKHPFKTEIADFIIAWGLFTSTSDFDLSMEETISLMKKDSFMYSAEPVMEHALIYALLMQDHEELMRILDTKTRASMWNLKDFRYRVYTQNEVNSSYDRDDLELVKKEGIPVLPSLLFGGLFTVVDADESQKKKCWEAIENADCSWYRQLTFLSKRIS